MLGVLTCENRAVSRKGSSGKADSARMFINTASMHVELLALRVESWFASVYSEDNLSDLPF
jgi:hypothetical protein